MIDAKNNFKGHVDYTCEKAENASASLTQMMPTIGGTTHRLLVGARYFYTQHQCGRKHWLVRTIAGG